MFFRFASSYEFRTFQFWINRQRKTINSNDSSLAPIAFSFFLKPNSWTQNLSCTRFERQMTRSEGRKEQKQTKRVSINIFGREKGGKGLGRQGWSKTRQWGRNAGQGSWSRISERPPPRENAATSNKAGLVVISAGVKNHWSFWLFLTAKSISCAGYSRN